MALLGAVVLLAIVRKTPTGHEELWSQRALEFNGQVP